MNKLSFPNQTEAPHVIWFQSTQQFWGEADKNTESEASRTKVNKLPWPLVFIKEYLTDLIYINFDVRGYNNFRKNSLFAFSPYKSQSDRILPWCKIGQIQAGVSIWTVEPETLILHIKFQGHRLFSSRQEDFQRFSLYMGMALCHVTQTLGTYVCLPTLWWLHM